MLLGAPGLATRSILATRQRASLRTEQDHVPILWSHIFEQTGKTEDGELRQSHSFGVPFGK